MKLFRLMLLPFLLLALSGNACAKELRIILDEDFNWLTRAEADKTIARIKAAGFNVFVPCIWHGRGVSWKSTLAPKEPLWANKKFALQDPLAYLIEKAHAEGIEVHPWFTVALRQREFMPQFYDEGTPEKSFDIQNEAFRAYITEVIAEVAAKYPVDGINLDYIRAKGVCLSEHCIDAYREATGADLRRDFGQFKQLGSPGWTRIASWNGAAVDDTVDRIVAKVKAVKPDLPISVSSHAGMQYLLGEGTDSIKWANAGKIDFILHMDYADLEKIRVQLLNSALARLHDKQDLILMVGNYIAPKLPINGPQPRPAIEVQELLRYSLAVHPDTTRVALYEYRFLTDEQIPYIAELFGRRPVSPPRFKVNTP